MKLRQRIAGSRCGTACGRPGGSRVLEYRGRIRRSDQCVCGTELRREADEACEEGVLDLIWDYRGMGQPDHAGLPPASGADLPDLLP